jgi:hypothetical protein
MKAEAFYNNASSAWFCVQPTGDSPLRRSMFDCIQAGSIPVVFTSEAMEVFPFRDYISPENLMLELQPEVGPKLFTDVLPAVPMHRKQQYLRYIAEYHQVLQYSLTPQSQLITWDKLGVIEAFDDALTLSLKLLLNKLCTAGAIPRTRCFTQSAH